MSSERESTQVTKPEPSVPDIPESTEDSPQIGDTSVPEEVAPAAPQHQLVESADPEPRSPMPAGSPGQSLSISIEGSRQYEGPIPDAVMMAGYKEIDPDLPNRIMAMAEQSAASNREVHKLVTRAAISERRNGQWLSGAITIATIVRDGITGSTGLTTLVIGIVAGIYVFTRLPEWWHSWRRPPGDEIPQVEDQNSSDSEEPN